MANLKASIKDVRKTKKRTENNVRMKRRYKNSIKSLKASLSEKNEKKSKELLSKAYKILDKTAKKGVINKGNASRKKSRLAKQLNSVFNKTAPDVKNN